MLGGCGGVLSGGREIPDLTLHEQRREEIKEEKKRKRWGLRMRLSYEHHCDEENPRGVKYPVLREYFDEQGRKTKTIKYEDAGEERERREYAYAAEGHKVRVYKNASREVSEILQYDAKGWPEARLVRLHATEVWKKDAVEKTYDQKRRLTSVITTNYKGGKLKEEYFYYHDGDENYLSKQETKEYDYHRGDVQLVDIKWYNKRQDVVRQVVSRKHYRVSEIRYFHEYDVRGRLLRTEHKEDSLLFGLERYAYEEGRLRRYVYNQINARGDTTHWVYKVYDENEQLISRRQESTQSVNPYANYRYDKRGILLSKEEFSPNLIPNHHCTFYRYAFY